MPVAPDAKKPERSGLVIMTDQTVHACYCMLFSTILFL